MAAQVCTPWILPADLCCEGDPEVTSCDGSGVSLVFPFTDDDIVLAASNILFARTCFIYSGDCATTIWPCTHGCCGDHFVGNWPSDWTGSWPSGAGIGPWSGSDRPYECNPCIRGSVMTLDGYRPRDITITVDGDVLDASNYRVQGNMVIRTDGVRWPRNNFGMDVPGAPGAEIVVAYTYGAQPPVELKMAAAALACELKKACNDPSSCALPSRVTSISRQGVGMSLMDLQQLLMTGKTGIPIVDYALDAHGNCGSDTLYDPVAPIHGYRVV